MVSADDAASTDDACVDLGVAAHDPERVLHELASARLSPGLERLGREARD